MQKILSFIGTLAVATVNVVVLILTSTLAAGGDGDPSGVYTVLIFGGFFIFALTCLALYRCANEVPAIGTAALALPTACAVGVVFLVGARLLGFQVG